MGPEACFSLNSKVSLILSCFLSSIIRHLSTDGLEEVVLTIADENSVTRNPIWPGNSSSIFTKNTQIIACFAVFFSSCLERASVSSYWPSMESFGLMLSYYSMSGFPVLEKPVNRNGPISICHLPSFLVLITAGAPFGEVAMPHVCSKKNSLILVLDQCLIVNKNR